MRRLFLRLEASLGKVFAIRRKTPAQPSHWLDYLVEVADGLHKASELVPFPFVKAGAGIAVAILQQIQAVESNQSEFRDLLEAIINVVQLTRDQVVSSNTIVVSPKLQAACIDFHRALLQIQEELHQHVRSTSKWKEYVLSSAIIEDVARHRRRMEDFQRNFMLSTVIQTHNWVEEIRDGMNQLLPRILVYPWEGSSNRVIWLTDILAVETPVPIEFCQTWEIFVDLLLFMHKRRPGKRYIDNGDFELETNDNNARIDLTTWNSVIRSGLRLKMSAVLRSKYSSAKDSRQCPSCSIINTNASLGSKIICEHCGTNFRVFRVFLEEIVNAAEKLVSLDMVEGSVSGPSSLQISGATHDKTDDDTRYVRRFHILQLGIQQTTSLFCPVPDCERSFAISLDLEAHIVRSHKEEKSFICHWPGCGEEFAGLVDCEQHEQLYTNSDHEQLLASEVAPVELENHQIIQTPRPPPFTFAQTLMEDDEIFFATFPNARPSGWVPSFELVSDQSLSGDENPFFVHNASAGYAVPSSEVMPILSNSSPILGWTGTETTAQIVAASESIPRIMDSLHPSLSFLSLHIPHPSAVMFDDGEAVQSPMVIPSQQYSMDFDVIQSAGTPAFGSASTSVPPEAEASDPRSRVRVRIPISGTIDPSLLSDSSGNTAESSGLPSTSTSYSRRNSRIFDQVSELAWISAFDSLTAMPVRQAPTRKPALACLFCRGRKIACGPSVAGSEDRTCNQCRRRSLTCNYPPESHHGMRKKNRAMPPIKCPEPREALGMPRAISRFYSSLSSYCFV